MTSLYPRKTLFTNVQNSIKESKGQIKVQNSLLEHCTNLQQTVTLKENKNTQIRDAIVIGIKDRDLPERMQLKEDLTLEMAITMARQSEIVKAQVRDKNHDNERADEINRGARPKHSHNRGATRQPPGNERPPGNGQRQGRRPSTTQENQPCTQCSKRHGSGTSCPAMGQICYKCSKPNHFAVCCKTKIVHKFYKMLIQMGLKMKVPVILDV